MLGKTILRKEGDYLEGIDNFLIECKDHEGVHLVFIVAHGMNKEPFEVCRKSNFNIGNPSYTNSSVSEIFENLSELKGSVCVFMRSCYANNALPEFLQLPQNITVILLDQIGEKVTSEKHLPPFINTLTHIKSQDVSTTVHQIIETLQKEVGDKDVGCICMQPMNINFKTFYIHSKMMLSSLGGEASAADGLGLA